MNSVGEIWHSASEKTGDVYDSVTESMSKKWDNIKETIDPQKFQASIDKLHKKISVASTYLVNLAIIFVFQTIVSPLIVLWGMIKMAGYLLMARA